MYFALIFGTKNTWDDWHLVPTSQPVFATPKLKTNFIDIPGGDGALDFSEALSGHPVYNNREGSLEYIVINGDTYGTLLERRTEIINYLHGKRMQVTMEEDPNHYYEGRFTVDNWKSNEAESTIIINYVLDPYKIHITTGERSL